MKDTLAAFPNKQIIAHSLGNQMVMDMLRQNMYAGPGGSVADIGLSKYIILEAAMAKSMFYPVPDGRMLANWRGLFKGVPAHYTDVTLHHLRKTEDYAVKWFFRANETIKKFPQVWRRVNTAAVLLDNPANAFRDNRVFEWDARRYHAFRPGGGMRKIPVSRPKPTSIGQRFPFGKRNLAEPRDPSAGPTVFHNPGA